MILSGWLNLLITVFLFGTLAAVVLYYYLPRSKKDEECNETPKYRMLEDDDEPAERPAAKAAERCPARSSR